MRYTVVIVLVLSFLHILATAQSTTGKKPDLVLQPTLSGVQLGSDLSSQQQENLFVLARVWGFLKYYHPEVARGKYNFDSCLFSIMSAVSIAESKSSRERLLSNWINTLGDENKYPLARVKTDTNFHTRPNLAWINDRDFFSEELSKRLNNIFLHRDTGARFYAGPAQEGNVSFVNEASYKSMNAEDDGFRMLALFRYWNAVEYFFPYKHLFKQNWTGVLKEFIPEFASNRTALDYRLTCWRLINQVHDTHASIYRDSLLNNWTGMKGPALSFKMIDKKVIVTDYLNDSLARFETVKPGDEIVAVNGTPVMEIRKAFDPYICASNATVADRNFLWRFLFYSRNDSLMITFKRGDNVEQAAMHLYFRPPYQNGDSWRMPMYQLLANDIGYIDIGKIKTDSLAVIFKAFKNTKGLILDLRNYPREFMPFAMGKYLKPKESPFVRYTGPDFTTPGAFKYISYLNNGASDTDRIETYKGRIVILVNEQTQSSAEFTALALRSAPRAVVMGSQTAGADGDISYVPFPGGFFSPFSGLGIFYPDGRETQGVGIVPDIFVYPTQKGFAKGKDEVLEQAKEYIRSAKSF